MLERQHELADLYLRSLLLHVVLLLLLLLLSDDDLATERRRHLCTGRAHAILCWPPEMMCQAKDRISRLVEWRWRERLGLVDSGRGIRRCTAGHQ